MTVWWHSVCGAVGRFGSTAYGSLLVKAYQPIFIQLTEGPKADEKLSSIVVMQLNTDIIRAEYQANREVMKDPAVERQFSKPPMKANSLDQSLDRTHVASNGSLQRQDSKVPSSLNRYHSKMSKESMDSDGITLNDDDKSSRTKKFRRFIFYLFFGTIFWLSPAIVLMIKYPMLMPNFNIFLEYNDLLALDQLGSKSQGIRWSLWVACSYMTSIAFWELIDVIPAVCVTLVTRIYGVCSEKVRERLQYIPSAKTNIWLMTSCIFNFALYIAFFCQFLVVPLWLAFQQAFSIIMAFSILLFLQRLIVLSIASDFHRHSYHDRIIQSRVAIKIIDRLREAISVIALTNVFKMVDFDGSQQNNTAPSMKRDSSSAANRLSWNIFKFESEHNHLKTAKENTGVRDESLEDKIHDIEDQPAVVILEDQHKAEPLRTSSNRIIPEKITRDTSDDKRFAVKERIQQGLCIGGDKRLKGQTLDLISDKSALILSGKIFKALLSDSKSHVIKIETFYP